MDTPVTRRADEITVGDLVRRADDDFPTRVLEAGRVDGMIRLLLWTGTAEGRWRGPRMIDLDPGAICTVVGHWSPPTSP